MTGPHLRSRMFLFGSCRIGLCRPVRCRSAGIGPMDSASQVVFEVGCLVSRRASVCVYSRSSPDSILGDAQRVAFLNVCWSRFEVLRKAWIQRLLALVATASV